LLQSCRFFYSHERNRDASFTRKVEESIVVGDDVRITVLSIKGDRVRIGVEAPRTTSVHRLEVYTRNQEARS